MDLNNQRNEIIMDYEKKYKEALERAKQKIKDSGYDEHTNVFMAIFPELKESEGEKIRKEIIEYIKEQQSILVPAPDLRDEEEEKENKRYNIWIDWLEKKIESTEWSEEDEKGLGDALWCCKQAASITKDENDMGNVWYAETWIKSLKDRVIPQPLQEWSEDDEFELECILVHLRNYLHEDAYVGYEKWLKDKLKSLRPQKQWKPTKEQLKELEIVAKDNHLNPNLQILLEQLKQL